MKWANGHYRHKDGTPTGEVNNFLDASPAAPSSTLRQQPTAASFSPRCLKTVRQEMIDSGLSRGTINSRVAKIVRVFKWAASEEMVPPSVHHGLKTVTGLRAGKSGAKERESVKPVPDAFVDAVRPFVSRQVWTMIQVQRLTGVRPGEVCRMRTCDLDTSGKVWFYSPHRHKTEHCGRERKIPIGPKAQEIIRPWLRTDLEGYLFQPCEARRSMDAERRENRKSPMTPSQRARRRKAKPKRAPGLFYRTRAYTRAVHRTCKRAGIPVWGPNRLRHNAATFFRREFGLDVARAILGHSDAATTTIYAERDLDLATVAMERVG